MSLFADWPKWPSRFEQNHCRSETSGDFRSWDRYGSNTSIYGDGIEDIVNTASKTTILSERIFNHLDSIVHDFTVFDRPSRRHFRDEDQRGDDWTKHSVQSMGKDRSSCKEFIIPIKIEKTTNTDHADLFSSRKVPERKDATPEFGSVSPAKEDGDKWYIPIPILRESSSESGSSLKPPSPVVASGRFQTPPTRTSTIFLTPATVQDKTSSPNRSRSSSASSTPRNQHGSRSRQSPENLPGTLNKQTTQTDFEPRVIKIVEEIEEEERIIRPGPRFAPLLSDEDYIYCARDSETSTPPSRRPEESSSWKCDVKDDVSHDGDKSREREEIDQSACDRKTRQQTPCSSTGLSQVTPSPSYPIYDCLKPRLANTGRQVDYIRGDGNCFFRALSKEVYGTEDYHAEWRQAVCDVIGAHPHVFSQFVDCSTSTNTSGGGGYNTDTGGVVEHVSYMRQPGTWATSCEIYGAASLLRRQIYVLAPSPCQPRGQEEYLWLLFYPCSLNTATSRRGKRPPPTTTTTTKRRGRGARGNGSSASSTSGVDGTGGEEDEDEEAMHPCYVTLCHTNGNHYDRITPAAGGVCNCQLAPPCLNGASLLMDSVGGHIQDFQEEDEEEEEGGDRWKEGDEDEDEDGDGEEGAFSWFRF